MGIKDPTWADIVFLTQAKLLPKMMEVLPESFPCVVSEDSIPELVLNFH